jgi:3-hydroxyisobutyrate dehydrogenase-like beta-hydroxyacid dehydrogenase
MGLPMAQSLLRAGFELTVHNRSQGPVEELALLGARRAQSPAEAAARCDLVLTCLPDVAAVEQVYRGAQGLVPASRPGQLLADLSTVGPDTSRAIAAAAEACGAAFLDAPISGGVERAQDATLTIMVGGPAEAFQHALPAFQAMGKHIYHMGPSGAGSITKLLNQLLVVVHSAAAAEALLLAHAAGVDPAQALEVLDASWGASHMLRRNGPVTLERAFSGARAPLQLMAKDVDLVCALAERLGVSLPQGEAARELVRRAAQRGLLEHDVAALVLPLEEAAGLQVQRRARSEA